MKRPNRSSRHGRWSGTVALLAATFAACQSTTVSGLPDVVTVGARVEANVVGPAGASLSGGIVNVRVYVVPTGELWWESQINLDSTAVDSVVVVETPAGPALGGFFALVEVRADPPPALGLTEVAELVDDVLFNSPIVDTVRVRLAW